MGEFPVHEILEEMKTIIRVVAFGPERDKFLHIACSS